MKNVQHRNVGIDILKFFAVILITNSHMDLLYGRWSILATGGGQLVMRFFSSAQDLPYFLDRKEDLIIIIKGGFNAFILLCL